MNFECFCAAIAAQKHSIKTNPPQDWGGMGGVDNLMANRNQSDKDTRGTGMLYVSHSFVFPRVCFIVHTKNYFPYRDLIFGINMGTGHVDKPTLYYNPRASTI